MYSQAYAGIAARELNLKSQTDERTDKRALPNFFSGNPLLYSLVVYRVRLTRSSNDLFCKHFHNTSTPDQLFMKFLLDLPEN